MDSPADSVREKLMSNEVPKKSIHEATQEFGHLRLLLSNFLFNEESNSVIVLGSPGAGKTTVKHSHMTHALGYYLINS